MKSRRRLILLAILMILLVSSVSFFSTHHLYNTSLKEQRKRLLELVQSQEGVLHELGRMGTHFEAVGEHPVSRDAILALISTAHSKFHILSQTGEFTVARRAGDNVKFLILNGKIVEEDHELRTPAIGGPLAKPMQLALSGKTGTIIGTDYRGAEVLAAYTPLTLQYESLGLVVKIDIKEIKAPFIDANVMIISVGILLTMLCTFVFFRISEPIVRDIKESEKQYRVLVEGTHSFVLRANSNEIITFANQRAMGELGDKGSPLIGSSLQALLQLEALHLNSHTDGSRTNVESATKAQTVFRDGREGWVSWTISRIFDEDSSEVEYLCVGHDVTQSHLATLAQREVEERFRAIAKASPVGIVIAGEDGSLLYANEKMHELTKTSLMHLAGRGWLKRVHPEDRTMIMTSWFTPPFKGNKRREFRMTTQEGDLLWVLGQIVQLGNSEGKNIGYVLTFTDITRIKKTEAMRSRLAAAIKHAAEIVIITDIDGTIVYVNPAFEKVTGYSYTEAVGETPRILKSGEHKPKFYANLWGKLAKGKTWSGRFVNLRKNGEAYTQDSTIAPIRDNRGTIIGYVELARDISQQLVIEGQLRQAQKLESIGELAAGIAHEINTPSQYVLSNLQFIEESQSKLFTMLDRSQELVDHLKKPADDRDNDKLEALVSSAIDEKELQFLKEDVPNAVDESMDGLKRISTIVQSVKQLAHPGEMTKGYHDLNQIIRDAVTVSTNEWKYVAEIEFDLAEGLPTVNCLKGEVGQVVLNLIVNSAHAIEGEKDATCTRGTISLKTYAKDDSVVFEVKDNGTGMPESIQQRIFDPFFTTKDVGKGTGQGLAITHNVIVNMHSGSIRVESEEGNGTTFIVELPVNDADSTEEVPDDHPVSE